MRLFEAINAAKEKGLININELSINEFEKSKTFEELNKDGYMFRDESYDGYHGYIIQRATITCNSEGSENEVYECDAIGIDNIIIEILNLLEGRWPYSVNLLADLINEFLEEKKMTPRELLDSVYLYQFMPGCNMTKEECFEVWGWVYGNNEEIKDDFMSSLEKYHSGYVIY
jgi:hypothetical protein